MIELGSECHCALQCIYTIVCDNVLDDYRPSVKLVLFQQAGWRAQHQSQYILTDLWSSQYASFCELC